MPIRHALAVAVLAWCAVAAAQPEFDQMRDLITRGYYNSASQLNGPELVNRHPDSAEAHYLYARALYLSGDLGRAREQLDRALSLSGDPDDPRHIHLHGLLRASEGDPDGALRALRNAFLRTGEYAHAMDWGRIAWQVGAYREAIEAFEAAAATARGARELWPHLNRGRILMFLGEAEAALDAFHTVIEVFEAVDPGGARPPSPAVVEAFYRMGETLEALGRLEQAETYYRAARSTDPNYLPAATALDRLARRTE